MKILVTNDDGYNADGIRVLASALATVAEIDVVAPKQNCSGASHSLTLDRPLRISRAENGFIRVNGTPTDCVHLAITGLLSHEPDLVASGINAGSNMGDDVLYSGTVAAAMEGRFLGLPSLAISMNSWMPRHYDTGAAIALRLIQHFPFVQLSSGAVLNVNVPDLPLSEIKGIRLTRLGGRHRSEPLVQTKDPRGHTVYWIGAPGQEADAGPGTDFEAVAQGYVSVTPLHFDLTSQHDFENMGHWLSNVCSEGVE
jgi:5'-nucleotidase